MKLKLKENPREWQKFTASVSVLLAILAWVLHRRGSLPVPLWVAWIPPAAIAMTALARPIWFRGFYRIGMTVGYHLGQTVGKVLLVALYLCVVTPIGLFLRLTGKDLLHLKRNTSSKSYWHTAKKNTDFDRQF